MKVKTYSGSLYEVDPANKRVRRVSGKTEPSNSSYKDGEWRGYKEIGSFHPSIQIMVGRGMVIVWDDVKMTQTSSVVSITEDVV